ncbi:hypothetical protein TCAL_15025 [Tigriopus californicus]|uniref:C2H2-type domain-containing protein n=1 Tax=Tigriopus californicus TaxID=6832 RepID=A0A553NXA9_TIGCA|nr:hypothetical protein TCAL_15025 [Tigriopus californicus]
MWSLVCAGFHFRPMSDSMNAFIIITTTTTSTTTSCSSSTSATATPTPAASSTSPTTSTGYYDVVLSVCGIPFPAKKQALMENFGYLKALLDCEPSSSTLWQINHVAYLNLANLIPYDIFSILYSCLDRPELIQGMLNLDNAYQVLLYAQVLQMPQIYVDHIKRGAGLLSSIAPILVKRGHEDQDVPGPTIHRPIANRAAPLLTMAPLWNQLYRQTTPDIVPHQSALIRDDGHTNWLPNVHSLSGRYEESSSRVLEDKQERVDIENDHDDDDEIVDVGNSQDEKENLAHASSTLSTRSKAVLANKELTWDIAACDGPIRFKRILNPLAVDYLIGDLKEEIEATDEACHPHATPEQESKPGASKPTTSTAANIYKCVFCSHVFKSYYCYQKHKRRHLNPLTVGYQKISNSQSGNVNNKHNFISLRAQNTTNQGGQSPIIKDINVQFFPCKICGSKFPSYYFVHKHKKLWHDNNGNNNEEEEEEEEDHHRHHHHGNNKNNDDEEADQGDKSGKNLSRPEQQGLQTDLEHEKGSISGQVSQKSERTN